MSILTFKVGRVLRFHREGRQGLLVSISRKGNMYFGKSALEELGYTDGGCAVVSFDDKMKWIMVRLYREAQVGALKLTTSKKNGSGTISLRYALEYFGCIPPADTMLIKPEWDASLNMLRIPYPPALCGKPSERAQEAIRNGAGK